MELENEVETKELGSSVGEFVSEFKDSRLLGVEGGDIEVRTWVG